MSNVLDAILFFDDLPEEQKKALQDKLNASPELHDTFVRWQQLQSELRSQINTSIPDRDHLVLLALENNNPELLSESESDQLRIARPSLEAALSKHPGLQHVIEDIGAAHTDFLATWQEFAPEQEADSNARKPFAGDRKPVQKAFARRKWTRVAVSVFTVLILATAGILGWRSQNLEIIRTSPGEFRVVELVDGSTVRLSEKSRITYTKHTDQFAESRSVSLKGQAFFDIAPNQNPFVVQTATATTEALGTRFSVEANRSKTKVILTSGRVDIASRQKRDAEVITLAPGEMTEIYRRSAPTEPAEVDNLASEMSWTGLLVFHNTPLPEVASHLEQQYDVSVSISPDLNEERWVATYNPDTLSVNQILDNLATTLGAHIEEQGDDSFHLTR